ncbi:hypothetical protein CCUS01_07288 [Colletotrichum cuscutae]|uniref:Uncharacterized protein n=1 Tax=Colletotrichum cuscutae TaxID=1209917 RepID=A0AAI9Y0A7_9PEZI|nr:hypothetical protein CCUS01_07288 [Colletotrichum cuscutae]
MADLFSSQDSGDDLPYSSIEGREPSSPLHLGFAARLVDGGPAVFSLGAAGGSPPEDTPGQTRPVGFRARSSKGGRTRAQGGSWVLSGIDVD